MAIFKLTARDKPVSLIVRARCISCARQLAVDRSPANEVRMWRDPERSSVHLIEYPERVGYLTDGQHGIIKRINHDDDT